MFWKRVGAGEGGFRALLSRSGSPGASSETILARPRGDRPEPGGQEGRKTRRPGSQSHAGQPAPTSYTLGSTRPERPAGPLPGKAVMVAANVNTGQAHGAGRADRETQARALFPGNLTTIFLSGIGVFTKELEPSHEESCGHRLERLKSRGPGPHPAQPWGGTGVLSRREHPGSPCRQNHRVFFRNKIPFGTCASARTPCVPCGVTKAGAPPAAVPALPDPPEPGEAAERRRGCGRSLPGTEPQAEGPMRGAWGDATKCPISPPRAWSRLGRWKVGCCRVPRLPGRRGWGAQALQQSHGSSFPSRWTRASC